MNKAKSTLPFPCIFSLTGRKKAIKGEAFSKIRVYFNLRSKLNNSVLCVCSAGIPRYSIQSFPFKGRNPTSGQQLEVCVQCHFSIAEVKVVKAVR